MATTSRKRRFEEDSLQIRLGSSTAAADPIVADRALLSAFSSCVRGLPADAAEWDISNLSIEGQAVERSTVVAWLNSIYQLVHKEPFEQQQPNLAHSMTGLAQLLLFADAVGSSTGLILSCMPQAEALHLSVKLGEQQLQLPADCGLSFYLKATDDAEDTYTLEVSGIEGQCFADDLSTATVAGLRQQAEKSVELLRFLAHKLQLQPLQQLMHEFIKANTRSVSSLLFGAMRSVLTDRVLEAAAGNKELVLQLLANHFSTEHGGMQPQSHAEQLLKPTDLTEEQQQPLSFKAELTRDAFGCRKGEIVRVTLALIGDDEPCITINGRCHVAQLLIGPVVWDAASMQRLLGPAPSTEAS